MGAARASSGASPPASSTVTLFPGEGPRGVVDQLVARARVAGARRSPRACARVHHPKLPLGFDAILVVGPEHARVFAEAGWDQGPAAAASCTRCCSSPAPRSCRGAGGIAEGVPESPSPTRTLPKFRPGGLLIVHAGGGAGLFSAIIGGWANGASRQPAGHPGGRAMSA